jgi:nucleoside-diphosphate-sugar epimerase
MNDTDYKKILEINLMFTIELIKFSNAKKIEEFIGFGSYVEFDRNVSNQPDSYSFYALTKIFQRKITKFFSKEFRVPVTYLTLNHVYGGDEKKRIISKLINSFLTGNTINLDYGLRKIDYVNILDVLDAILIIVMKKNDSNLNNWKFLEYGIGTKKFYNLRELVDLFKSEFNVHLPVIFDEINTNTDKPDYVWQDYTYPPSWSPKITLIDGLRRLIENKDNDEYK